MMFWSLIQKFCFDWRCRVNPVCREDMDVVKTTFADSIYGSRLRLPCFYHFLNAKFSYIYGSSVWTFMYHNVVLCILLDKNLYK